MPDYCSQIVENNIFYTPRMKFLMPQINFYQLSEDAHKLVRLTIVGQKTQFWINAFFSQVFHVTHFTSELFAYQL